MATSPSEPCVLALRESADLGARIAARLGRALLPIEEIEFEDGEHKGRPLESVRGRDVYVVASLHAEPGASVHDKSVRLWLLAGALRDAGAARVTAVTPYLCYQRKERRTAPRDPVSTRYLAQLFEAVGVDRIVALDVHDVAAYENSFRIPAEHLEARPAFAAHAAAAIGPVEAVVVSPDVGGTKRAERLRARLEDTLGRKVGLAIVEKHREDGVVRGGLVVGNVAGKAALLVDDMIATGTTLARAARACREAGAVSVRAYATHGLFYPPAAEVLLAAGLDEIVVTEAVPPFRLAGSPLSVTVLPLDALLAEVIGRLNRGGSVTALGGS